MTRIFPVELCGSCVSYSTREFFGKYFEDIQRLLLDLTLKPEQTGGRQHAKGIENVME
jgi:hypothetical protein